MANGRVENHRMKEKEEEKVIVHRMNVSSYCIGQMVQKSSIGKTTTKVTSDTIIIEIKCDKFGQLLATRLPRSCTYNIRVYFVNVGIVNRFVAICFEILQVKAKAKFIMLHICAGVVSVMI